LSLDHVRVCQRIFLFVVLSEVVSGGLFLFFLAFFLSFCEALVFCGGCSSLRPSKHCGLGGCWPDFSRSQGTQCDLPCPCSVKYETLSLSGFFFFMVPLPGMTLRFALALAPLFAPALAVISFVFLFVVSYPVPFFLRCFPFFCSDPCPKLSSLDPFPRYFLYLSATSTRNLFLDFLLVFQLFFFSQYPPPLQPLSGF